MKQFITKKIVFIFALGICPLNGYAAITQYFGIVPNEKTKEAKKGMGYVAGVNVINFNDLFPNRNQATIGELKQKIKDLVKDDVAKNPNLKLVITGNLGTPGGTTNSVDLSSRDSFVITPDTDLVFYLQEPD